MHTGFYGDIVSGRLNFKPTRSLRLNVFGVGSGYFNQNPEGLNIAQVQQDPRQPNPDALKYNEYQKTKRFTGGITGQWSVSDNQRLAFDFFSRPASYVESVPSSVLHRNLTPLEGTLQYNLETPVKRVKNYFGAGVDYGGQSIDAWARGNLGAAMEDSALLANSSITQSRLGVYVMDRVAFGDDWTVFMSGRYDRLTNSLSDKLKLEALDLSGSRVFTKPTGRFGVSFSPRQQFTLYSSWGSGFLPPATEELYANPKAIGGFNVGLVPATSQGPEAGVRGNIGFHLSYDAAYFYLQTKDDFERYRIVERPLETFYANGGESTRNGVEASLRFLPVHWLAISGAYTYSDFVYSQYVSHTYPGDLRGNYLPNSPQHQFYGDAYLQLPRRLSLGLNSITYSRAYVDATNKAWIGGYTLLGARAAKGWQYKNLSGSLFVSATNLTDKKYIGFTEPDPDGNSYQPGPGRQVFGGLEIRF